MDALSKIKLVDEPLIKKPRYAAALSGGAWGLGAAYFADPSYQNDRFVKLWADPYQLHIDASRLPKGFASTYLITGRGGSQGNKRLEELLSPRTLDPYSDQRDSLGVRALHTNT